MSQGQGPKIVNYPSLWLDDPTLKARHSKRRCHQATKEEDYSPRSRVRRCVRKTAECGASDSPETINTATTPAAWSPDVLDSSSGCSGAEGVRTSVSCGALAAVHTCVNEDAELTRHVGACFLNGQSHSSNPNTRFGFNKAESSLVNKESVGGSSLRSLASEHTAGLAELNYRCLDLHEPFRSIQSQLSVQSDRLVLTNGQNACHTTNTELCHNHEPGIRDFSQSVEGEMVHRIVQCSEQIQLDHSAIKSQPPGDQSLSSSPSLCSHFKTPECIPANSPDHSVALDTAVAEDGAELDSVSMIERTRLLSINHTKPLEQLRALLSNVANRFRCSRQFIQTKPVKSVQRRVHRTIARRCVAFNLRQLKTSKNRPPSRHLHSLFLNMSVSDVARSKPENEEDVKADHVVCPRDKCMPRVVLKPDESLLQQRGFESPKPCGGYCPNESALSPLKLNNGKLNIVDQKCIDSGDRKGMQEEDRMRPSLRLLEVP